MIQVFHYKNLSLIIRKEAAESYDYFYQRGALVAKTVYHRRDSLDVVLDYVHMFMQMKMYKCKYPRDVQERVLQYFQLK